MADEILNDENLECNNLTFWHSSDWHCLSGEEDFWDQPNLLDPSQVKTREDAQRRIQTLMVVSRKVLAAAMKIADEHDVEFEWNPLEESYHLSDTYVPLKMVKHISKGPDGEVVEEEYRDYHTGWQSSGAYC